MKKITIKIKGMHCSSCEMLVKDALEETDGIGKAELSHTDGSAVVMIDEDKVSVDDVKSIIKKEGYEV